MTNRADHVHESHRHPEIPAATLISKLQVNPSITTRDGVSLHARVWTGRGARGWLVVSHGLGEHAGCYEELAGGLSAHVGLVDVVAFDYRGHGLSPGRRGVVGHYKELLHDLQAVLDWVDRQDRRPCFLLGHSNGGQVAAHAALTAPERLDGVLLSNPSIELAAKVPPWKLRAGRLLNRWAPWVTLDSGLDDSLMTRDSTRYSTRRLDRLRHRRVSAPLFFGMIDGGREVVARAGEIRTPALIVLGEDDQVVDPVATRRFFDRLGSPEKSIRVYPGMRHEPLNDLGREAVVSEIVRWLQNRLDRCGSMAATTGA